MIAPLQHHLGEQIQDRYQVQGVLGSGAFGTVYRCSDLELDTLVAIKELHVMDAPGTTGDERTRALVQFRREALHLSNLRHPHIVSGHYQPHNGIWLVCPACGLAFKGARVCPEHGRAPVVLKQRNYLVMEYLDGPNLSEAAEQGGGVLPVDTALHYIRQIAEALKLIHSRGWVHRDVKPENIRLRAATDEAVLLDFGIATETGAAGDFTTRAQRHTTGGGTLGYAPDAPGERRHPDARSDVHALGMTLYRLLSGRDPLESDDLIALRKYPPRHFNAEVSTRLEELILRSIHYDPARRPLDGGEFLRELDALDNETDIVSTTVVTQPPQTVSTENSTLLFSSGEEASTLSELAELCDAYPREGQEYLFNGKIEDWLLENNRGILARRAREIREKYSRRERGLEAFLQATGEVAPPQMQAGFNLLDFGEVEAGAHKTIRLHLRNPDRGFLFGVLRPSQPCLHAPTEFDGNDVVIPMTLDARGLKRGVYSGELAIDSSAGELRIPFRVDVKSSSEGAVSTIVFWAVLGMFGGFVMRTLPLVPFSSTPGWNWLSWSTAVRWWPTAPLFGAALLGVLTPFIAGEALRRRSCTFALSVGLFTMLFSFFCGALGLEILMAGDAALHPIMHQITDHWAAGAWLFVGGLFGAGYGTLRRWGDLLSSRLLQVLLGWLVSLAIIYGLLAAARFLAPPHVG